MARYVCWSKYICLNKYCYKYDIVLYKYITKRHSYIKATVFSIPYIKVKNRTLYLNFRNLSSRHHALPHEPRNAPWNKVNRWSFHRCLNTISVASFIVQFSNTCSESGFFLHVTRMFVKPHATQWLINLYLFHYLSVLSLVYGTFSVTNPTRTWLDFIYVL